tara:strand:- start:21873 stop:22637 length:765 start_codon:yes stop_codon:yes gene_type:complete
MEREIAVLLFVVLVCMYFFVVRGAMKYNYIEDSFNVEEFKNEDDEDDVEVGDMDEDEDEDEVQVEEETAAMPVSDTIEIRDTIRRDSKVDSTLGYVYVDEQCGKIVRPEEDLYLDHQFAKQNDNIIEPETFISGLSNPSNETNDIQVISQLETEVEKCPPCNFKSGDIKSEMWDDSDLKPKPEVDSPYGFVYFPNKYWKMWHQRAPVCTPVNGACKVLPTYTEGTPVNVLDYTQIGSIMPKFEYKEDNECVNNP